MAEATQPDLAEFFKLSRPKKAPCRVDFAKTQLKPAERAQLLAALDTDKGIITNSAVQQWLASRGHETSVSAIVSHRKGTCTCGDE